MEKPDTELVFVYNAGSGMLDRGFDFLHKAISPDTYACNLCRISHGLFTEKKEWRQFVGGLPWPATFFHKDQFHERFPDLAAVPLPAIFMKSANGGIEMLASADEISRARSVDDLAALLNKKAPLG
jgi:hypothetical protein